MFRPKASLGLVLLGLFALAGWGCSKGPSQDDGKSSGAEVKKSDDSDSPHGGRSGRAVGKVLRKMQEDEKSAARNVPPGMGIRKYSNKTAAAPWEAGAPDNPFDRQPAKTRAVRKTEAKTMYEAPVKTEYKTDMKTAEKSAGGPSVLEEEVLSLLRQGRKIEAIKVYRAATNKGLKEAKDAVEALGAPYGIIARGV
jgi:hypothetical protein